MPSATAITTAPAWIVVLSVIVVAGTLLLMGLGLRAQDGEATERGTPLALMASLGRETGGWHVWHSARRGINGRLYVPVTLLPGSTHAISGWALVDTGASICVLERHVFERVAAAFSPPLPVERQVLTAGKRMESLASRLPPYSLRIGAASVPTRDVRCAVVELDKNLPWMDRDLQRDVLMVLGTNVLLPGTLRLQYAPRPVVMWHPRAAPLSDVPVATTVRACQVKAGVFTIPIRLAGTDTSHQWLLDTGANTTFASAWFVDEYLEPWKRRVSAPRAARAGAPAKLSALGLSSTFHHTTMDIEVPTALGAMRINRVPLLVPGHGEPEPPLMTSKFPSCCRCGDPRRVCDGSRCLAGIIGCKFLADNFESVTVMHDAWSGEAQLALRPRVKVRR